VPVSSESFAAERARWLAELSDALDEARGLAKAMGAAEGRVEAVELYARIEAVRLEVQMMRLRGNGARLTDFDPEWSQMLPWQRSA
jgi:hypothetical protein